MTGFYKTTWLRRIRIIINWVFSVRNLTFVTVTLKKLLTIKQILSTSQNRRQLLSFIKKTVRPSRKNKTMETFSLVISIDTSNLSRDGKYQTLVRDWPNTKEISIRAYCSLRIRTINKHPNPSLSYMAHSDDNFLKVNLLQRYEFLSTNLIH